jgi:hypothetical protein
MFARSVYAWFPVLALGFLLIGVFFVLGYGLILLPMVVIAISLMIGAALYHFGGE